MPVYDISPGVKGLIFDLDGTLADTMPWHFRAWQKACSRFGITMETEFLQAHTGAPGWEIAGEVIEINGKRGMISPEEILKMKMEE
ncbi:MAG TPA: HAD hydrolase-like protein, partial [Bacteroidales bacterium]|nr:HAD hydrolase-like protein [Bacteroidales bacterium]